MGEDRPIGLHLGEIIREMKVAAGESIESPDGDQEGVRIQEGFLWESAVEYMLGGVSLDVAMSLAFKRHLWALRSGIVRQLSLEKDGVFMTPDAYDPLAERLESYKVTRRTLRKALTADDFETNFWTWCVQEKAYCLAKGVDSVRWIVLWQAGDYSKGVGSGPKVLEATATWTAQELVDNWRVVMAHASAMRGK